MPRPGQSGGISRLGLQLALAFVGVAVAAVATAILVASLTISRDVQKLVMDQENDLARAVAAEAATVYQHSGWLPAGLGWMMRAMARSNRSAATGFSR